MSTHSTIILDRDALDILVRHGDVDPRMYDERPDGRFNLRVGGTLRAQLDALAVRHGLNHSGVIKRLEAAAVARKAAATVEGA